MSFSPRFRRNLLVVVGLLVSAGSIWLVARSIDLAETVDVLAHASPAALLAILGVVAIQLTLRAARWSYLLPVPEGRDRVSPRRLLPPLLAGYLGNAVLPARLGEAMRALIVSRRERIGATEALGSVLLERILDVATLAPLALFAAVLVGAPAWVVQVAAVATVGAGAVVAVLFTSGIQPILRAADRFGLAGRPGVRSLAGRFAATIGGRSRRSAIGMGILTCVVAWLFDATSFWLAAQAVGVELDFAGAMLVSGITVLGTAVPSAPGYVGTFELAAASVASALGAAPEAALAMALVAHAMTLLPMAFAGAIAMGMMGADLGEVAHTAEAGATGQA